MDAMVQLPLPAGLSAGTFPAKLWSLANDPRVLSMRWDSEARGLLVDRSLFERELLRLGGAQGPAPHAFRATQFSSFVCQLYRYGFRKVPGQAGAAAPGDAGAWVHYTNPWFRRDRPDLLLRIRRRSAANTQRRAAGPEGCRRPPCGSQQIPGPRPLPDERHGRARFQPLPRERPPLARRPPCGFHLLHRERPGPARREGPSRFQELYGERPLPAERELLRVPPCHFQGFHGEQLLPPRWEGPRSRLQELYGEQPPPLDRELLWMQPCSFQQLHREQQPPASNPPAAAGTSAPHAPAGSAGCAASTASSSAQNAPAQEESPALDLGLEIEKMIREIRNSLPVKAPSAQGNINVAPESPGEDPMNRAEAEEVSSGTESCGNSSPEPEEPDPMLLMSPGGVPCMAGRDRGKTCDNQAGFQAFPSIQQSSSGPGAQFPFPGCGLRKSRHRGSVALLVAMAHDKEPEVALEVLKLLPELDRNLEEALSDEDCRSVFPIVFVSSRALTSAAGKFLFQRLLDPQHGADVGSSRGFFLRSQFSVVSALLELLQHLELGTLRSARMDKFLERVLERILPVSHSHSRPFPGLSAASRALRRLWHPELVLGRLGDIARARLGDSLGTGATPR
ncbi:hypothetical protein DUI87_28581 [Hirundo rustica rustica]|uniref:HSF-type DNA-binding domain-containing protein n=1 Tax=Hirundo rustica rustica TaxID=333673 RepID=A0A3M0J3N3_HIRRU|nr:hypothetical protein DUI87_28581 [Hirundo rustica rustica]